MRTERAGVAISTTGDEHRLGFLETCVVHWEQALLPGDSMFVTVDGDEAACRRVAEVVYDYTASVYRVGQAQPDEGDEPFGRQGVAINKNTGLELLMDQTQVEHLFLSDDDTWPIYQQSLGKHIDLGLAHSLVCWGQSRLTSVGRQAAVWSWPRGSMMYQCRSVVESVGGMDERFGPGGHEHVEWSNRIYNAGLTPAPYCSPPSYATRNGRGAAVLWHGEDMRRPGETAVQLGARRRTITSVRRKPEDWEKINAIMTEREGSDAFVPYRAHENGRSSATLCENVMSQGDCAVEPATPRSEK